MVEHLPARATTAEVQYMKLWLQQCTPPTAKKIIC